MDMVIARLIQEGSIFRKGNQFHILDPQAGRRSAVDFESPGRTYDSSRRIVEFPASNTGHVLCALKEEAGSPKLLGILAQRRDIVFT
ncbi:MAG TPA: hypothetical protein VMV83_11230 [Rectinemataceae bacterium]|nr:hypothetical protein [Rectinemataceae bacterium]